MATSSDLFCRARVSRWAAADPGPANSKERVDCESGREEGQGFESETMEFKEQFCDQDGQPQCRGMPGDKIADR